MKKKLLATFDYELFLGVKSGSLKETLIQPTEKILTILETTNSSAIFFVDATFLLRLKSQPELKDDFELISEQIRQIVKIGSRVELHIHPHWRDAEYKNDGHWYFNSFENFRLHNFSDSEIVDLFKESKNILETIIHQDFPDYKIKAFRAGGWALHPFDRLQTAFREIEIKFDFSVLPNMAEEQLPTKFYNYLEVPKKDTWKFSKDPTISEEDGMFTEVPMSTFRMLGLVLFVDRFLRKYSYSSSKNIDVSKQGVGTKKVSYMGFVKRFFKVEYRMLTIDSVSHFYLKFVMKYILRKENLVVVGHPKNGESVISNFKYLCENHNVNLDTIELHE